MKAISCKRSASSLHTMLCSQIRSHSPPRTRTQLASQRLQEAAGHAGPAVGPARHWRRLRIHFRLVRRRCRRCNALLLGLRLLLLAHSQRWPRLLRRPLPRLHWLLLLTQSCQLPRLLRSWHSLISVCSQQLDVETKAPSQGSTAASQVSFYALTSHFSHRHAYAHAPAAGAGLGASSTAWPGPSAASPAGPARAPSGAAAAGRA